MNNLRRSARNVWRSKLRAIVIILITAVGVTLALTMLVMRLSVDNQVNTVKANMGTRISIRSPESFGGMNRGGATLDAELYSKVQNLPHITSIQRYLTGMLGATGQNIQSGMFMQPGARSMGDVRYLIAGQLVMGIEPGTPARMLGASNSELVEGRWFNTDDEDQAVVIVGQGLAEQEKLQVGQTYTVAEQKLQVVGVMSSGSHFGDMAIVLPIASAQKILGQEGMLSQIELTVDSIDNVDAVVAQLKEVAGEDADVIYEADQVLQRVGQELGTIRTITATGVILAAIVVAMVLFLTMLLVVKQRAKEIGVLKAIGATRRDIMQQFVAEAVIFSMLGALAGTVLFTTCGEKLVNSIVDAAVQQRTTNIQPPGWADVQQRTRREPPNWQRGRMSNTGLATSIGDVKVEVDWNILLYGLLGTMLAGAVGGLIPAIQAASLKPAEVLRNE
jgi:putative ABC transport system permease protein